MEQRNAPSNSLSGSAPIPGRGPSVRGLPAVLIGLAWVLVCVFLYREPLRSLVDLVTHNDNMSQIPLIPLISGWLLYRDRKRLWMSRSTDFPASLTLLIPAILVVYFTLYRRPWNASVQLTLLTISFVLLLEAGFVAVVGRKAAHKAWFPMAFLFLAVPLPDALMNRFIYTLQAGSAAVAEVLFDLSGVPVVREGFIFHLRRISIEVAQECSGIRSSISLFVLALLISHFAFRPFWKKLVFVAAGLLIMVVKNGVRIVTLTLLANYVDAGFLFGRLHHEGGIVFFLFGLGLLWPVYWLLSKNEGQKTAKNPPPSVPSSTFRLDDVS